MIIFKPFELPNHS